ncbi:MAG: N-acetylmuramoyl-L-alanine amidase family protein [Acidaminococcaceae bacterium]
MLNRLLVLLMFLFSFTFNMAAEASGTEITALHWGVSKENVFRVVLDCTGPTDAQAVLDDDALKISVGGGLKPYVSKAYKVKSDTVENVELQPTGEKTVLQLPLTRKLANSDYKIFVLKKDPVTKRPDRIVIDIGNGSTNFKPAAVIPEMPAKPNFATGGGIKGKMITLDPGHGGTDPGAIGKQGTKEKDVTLKIAMKVRDYLLDKGARISMTRTNDKDVYGPDATDAQELQARVDVAQANAADLFVSIHCNASISPTVGGISTYFFPKTDYDKIAASAIQEDLTKKFGLDDLGVRQANFYVNKRSSMPTVLIETAFISNQKEEKLLRSNWFQNKMAKAIADGIEDYFSATGGDQ